jgi:WD40 repeat protein
VHTIQHDGGFVWVIGFSADGTLVATGDDIGTVRVSGLTEGDPGAPVELGGFVCGAGLLPDGSALVAANRTRVGAYVAATGEALWEVQVVHPEFYQAMHVSPDRTRLAVTTHRGISVLDTATGALVQEVTLDHDIRDLAWSPDGTRLAVATELWDEDQGEFSGTARVLDALTGAELGRCAHDDACRAVAFTPDGESVLSGGADHTVRLFAAAGGVPAWLAPCGIDGTASAIVVDPTGRFGLCGTEDGPAAVVRLSIGTRKYEKPEPSPEMNAVSTELVAADPMSRWAAVASQNGALFVFSLDDGTERFPDGLLLGPDGGSAETVSAVAFSPDGAYLLVATGTVVHVVANGPAVPPS